MTLTLPLLTAILLAVFLCPFSVLIVVLHFWRQEAEKREEERREFMDRLFSRDWNEYKAFEVAQAASTPQPATEAEEYELWQKRSEAIYPGLSKIGTIVDE